MLKILALAICSVALCGAQEPPSPADPDVRAPALVHTIEPEYSPYALAARIEGTVVLGILVDESGVPRDISVTRGLEPGLDAKAIEAVREWRFIPGTKGGKPVPVKATVQVSFRIAHTPQVVEHAAPAPSPPRDSGVSERAHQSTLNQPFSLRWEPGSPNCARFLQNGVVLKAVQGADLRVYASLTDTGKDLYAYVIAQNESPAKSFDLLPSDAKIQLATAGDNFLMAVPPRKIVAKSRRSANRRSAMASLERLRAALPTPALEIRGTYGTAQVYTYDRGAIERANRHIAEIMAQQRSYEDLLKAFLLSGDSISPGKQISGAIYFPRKKNPGPIKLYLLFRPTERPGNAANLVEVYIPFGSDEVGAQ